MEESIKEWWFLLKKYNNLHLVKFKMDLPLDQFRFNLILRILITAYWASWIWNFFAFIPEGNEDDKKILWYNNKSNYSFRLISSLLFFLLWISQFRYAWLVYLTIWEIYITVIIYLYLIIKKRSYLKENKNKEKEIVKK